MTYAICSKCGQDKIGALTPCQNCRFRPSSEQEIDFAIILSDHYILPRELKKIGEKINNEISFDLRYYFASFRQRLLWRICKFLSLNSLMQDLFKNIEITTLKSRDKSAIIGVLDITKK